jgi:protein-tyrosine phosphatase
VQLLFVCLGNICRSPTAEGVMRSLVGDAGLEGEIGIDSAGTGAWHIGNPPDERASAAALARGIRLDGRARQVRGEDYERFDLLIAMDRSNVADLTGAAPDRQARERVRLLRQFDPGSAGARDLDVPDPYFGGPSGFADVFDLVYAACSGLLAQITSGELR